jgi:hypothetical protein
VRKVSGACNRKALQLTEKIGCGGGGFEPLKILKKSKQLILLHVFGAQVAHLEGRKHKLAQNFIGLLGAGVHER